MADVLPSGPGSEDEPSLPRRLASLSELITLPSSLYAPGIDAGGIGVAVVVHFAATGAGFTSLSASIQPRRQGKLGIVHRFFGRWPTY